MLIDRLLNKFYSFIVRYKFRKNHVICKSFGLVGMPIIDIRGDGVLRCDGSLFMVNTAKRSTLGINRRCKLTVYNRATLHVKGRVAMSNTVIIATKHVEIGNNVMIGGGATIIDCDFHSVNYKDWFSDKDEENMISKPVIIGNNVLIGMNSIILKGVSIGDGSIIGAGSVVATNIPENEIWGGNPAKFIKRNDNGCSCNI